MTAIIQVPSTFPIKLPQGEWINLASFRRVAIDDVAQKIHIIWDNDADSIYEGEQAQAILDALEVARDRATATGASQKTPSEEEKEQFIPISMVALALLSEAIENAGGDKAELVVEEFFSQAKYLYKGFSEEELKGFMHIYFGFLMPNA